MGILALEGIVGWEDICYSLLWGTSYSPTPCFPPWESSFQYSNEGKWIFWGNRILLSFLKTVIAPMASEEGREDMDPAWGTFVTNSRGWLSLALDIPFLVSILIAEKYQNELHWMESQIRFLLGIDVARMAWYGVLDKHLRWGICITYFFPLKTYILGYLYGFSSPFLHPLYIWYFSPRFFLLSQVYLITAPTLSVTRAGP